MDPKSGFNAPTQVVDTSTLDILGAVQYGVVDRVKELLEKPGTDVNQRDKENVPLLHWAAINNRIEVVNLLLEKGVDINAKVWFPIIRILTRCMSHLSGWGFDGNSPGMGDQTGRLGHGGPPHSTRSRPLHQGRRGLGVSPLSCSARTHCHCCLPRGQGLQRQRDRCQWHDSSLLVVLGDYSHATS